MCVICDEKAKLLGADSIDRYLGIPLTGENVKAMQQAYLLGMADAAAVVRSLRDTFLSEYEGLDEHCVRSCHATAYTHAANWLADVAAGVRK